MAKEMVGTNAGFSTDAMLTNHTNPVKYTDLLGTRKFRP